MSIRGCLKFINQMLSTPRTIHEIESNLHAIGSELHAIKQTVNLVARRRVPVRGAKIRCVFLVHHAPGWESLHDLFIAMSEAIDFMPVVISIARDFKHTNEVYGEEDVHQKLTREGVPHLRFSGQDFKAYLDVLKAIDPHVIFRQAPWEDDIPSMLRAAEICFSRICYIPYFANMILKGREGFDFDQYFHRMCWRIFCVSQYQFDLIKEKTLLKGANVVISGHPKFDRLLEAAKNPYWPINSNARTFRVLWTAHHSVRPDWLGFGTFHRIYEAFLSFAKRNSDIEFVFSPHPMLIESTAHGLLTRKQVDDFVREWSALPNAFLLDSATSYPRVFAASDVMITDGISFLTEYQFFNKPLIFFDSQQHEPFNEEGEATIRSAHRVTSTAELFELLRVIEKRGNDPLTNNRRELVNRIMPFPGKSSQRILSEIRNGLAAESYETK